MPPELPAPGASEARLERLQDGFFLGGDGLAREPSARWDEVAPALPDNGRKVEGTVLLVNGIMTSAERHLEDMQVLANTVLAVTGVHNATGNFFSDLVDCLKDKLGLGSSPSLRTVRSAVLEALDEGKPLHLVGHSQGALIISRAPPAGARRRLG